MNILIAIDGSEYAENALNFTLRFPFPHDSKMTLLTVVNDIPMMQAEIDALDDEQTQELDKANRYLHEEAERLLEQAGKRLRDDNWPGTKLVREGDPVDEILAAAEDIDADLIVVGSHGTGMTKHFLLGSVSDRILEYAPCSVLIVKPKDNDDLQEEIVPGSNAPYRIILAFDDSEVAHEALDMCSTLPLEEGSEIRVVNVMPLITAYRQDIRQHINNIWQQKKQIMQAELDKAVRSLQWATPNVITELLEGENVSEVILHEADKADSDLIVVGCKDKGKVKRFLLGSITHRMARYAKCSVWSVRRKTHEE